MSDGVHRHRLKGHERHQRRHTGDPCEEVPPTCEPADEATVPAGGNGRPEVHYDGLAEVLDGSTEIRKEDVPVADEGIEDASSAIEAATNQ